jgi:polyisoprenoid-binding protein YceI
MNNLGIACTAFRAPLRALPLMAMLAALPVMAAEMSFTFDPPQTQVHWVLDTALHTVHGTFQLKSGTVRFDPATGKASGALIVDAMSGQSGSESRDHRMHKEIIQSEKYREIVFTPDRVDGTVAPQGSSNVQVHGTFKLMNGSHELTLPIKIEMNAAQAALSTNFTVPYVKWGVKNPSVLFLHVNDKVDIEIKSVSRVGQ